MFAPSVTGTRPIVPWVFRCVIVVAIQTCGDEGSDDNDSKYDPLDDPDLDDDDHDEPNLDDDDENTHNENHNNMECDTIPGTVTDGNTMANDGDVDGNIAPVLQIHPDGLHTTEQAIKNNDTTVILMENDNAQMEDNAPDDIDTSDNIDITAEIDHLYGSRKAPYNLHPCKLRDYSHMHTVLESTMMTQYNMKKRIEMFRDAGTDAIL